MRNKTQKQSQRRPSPCPQSRQKHKIANAKCSNALFQTPAGRRTDRVKNSVFFFGKDTAKLIAAQQSIYFQHVHGERFAHKTYIGVRIQLSQRIAGAYAKCFRVIFFVANQKQSLFPYFFVHTRLAEKRIEDNNILIFTNKALLHPSALVLQSDRTTILCENRKARGNTY